MGLLTHFILFVSLTCVIYAQSDEPGDADGSEKPYGYPSVIDPKVQEEMARKREEMKKKGEDPYDTAHIKTGKNETKPKVETLYQPKSCKRKSINGDLMVVHYTGWVKKTGKKFDSTIDSRRRYAPFEFVIGTGYVIRAWDTGLLDMCPGEKRRLEVPSELAYGSKGLRGVIPPNSALIFLIDLLDLRKPTPNYAPMDLFTSLDKDGDQHLSREEMSQYVRYQSKNYRNKNAPPPTDEEHEKMVDDIMHKEDVNGDGKISHSEFSGPKARIEL